VQTASKQNLHGSKIIAMAQSYNFEGSYERQGSTFTNGNGITLAFASRKNFTPTKPREFIIYRTKGNQQGQFFSSIYKTADKIYKADHNKVKYTITFEDSGDQLTIKRAES